MPSIAPEGFEARTSVPGPRRRLRPHTRRWLVITASEDGELAWWDLRSRREDADAPDRDRLPRTRAQPGRAHRGRRHRRGHPVRRRDAPETVRTRPAALTGSPNWLLFSPDGKTVVSTSLDGTVTLWDVESATPRETLRGHSDAVQQPVFSPDGQTLYTVSTTERRSPGTSRVTAASSGRSRSRTTGLRPGVRRPSGEVQPRRPADRGRPQGAGAVELWDARELTPAGAPLRDRRGGQGPRLLPGRANARGRDPRAGDPLGRRVAIARPWPVRRLGRTCGVSFSADGRTLATGARRRQALGRGDRASRRPRSRRAASDLAFSADGR